MFLDHCFIMLKPYHKDQSIKCPYSKDTMHMEFNMTNACELHAQSKINLYRIYKVLVCKVHMVHLYTFKR